MYTSKAGFKMQERRLRNAALAPRSSVLSPQSSILDSQSGISLVELIMFIVIVSVALAGLLLVMNVTGKGSADPLIHKQSLAIAESLLEEIELQAFTKPDGGFAGPNTPANRSQFDCIMDYNGFATTGVYQLDGTTAVPGLEGYNVAVVVAGAALDSIPAASAALITVTVTEPGGQAIDAAGYKAKY
jgi:MSHA pilin protein MshD